MKYKYKIGDKVIVVEWKGVPDGWSPTPKEHIGKKATIVKCTTYKSPYDIQFDGSEFISGYYFFEEELKPISTKGKQLLFDFMEED